MLHWGFKGNLSQHHQVTTWKSPNSGDTAATQSGVARQPPIFDSLQLGTLLYDMYRQMFEQEDIPTFQKINQGNMQRAIGNSNVIHLIRKSFVLFLKLVRDRLQIPEGNWLQVMKKFFEFQKENQTFQNNLHSTQDLYANMLYHTVCTVPAYPSADQPPKTGRFADWDTVTPLVRIVLTIPPERVLVIKELSKRLLTPLLQCEIRGSHSRNIFTAVHAAFGRVIPVGIKSHPQVLFKEELNGWTGSDPLVASFILRAGILTSSDPMENLTVCFSVTATPAVIFSTPERDLIIFSTSLMDESHVHILPERPLPCIELQESSSHCPTTLGRIYAQIGESGAAVVELDDECELVSSLSSRISVTDEESKRLFGDSRSRRQSLRCLRVSFGLLFVTALKMSCTHSRS